jgi:anti-sigma factor RsiW
MDAFIKNRLEAYLAGDLVGREKDEVERRLAADADAARLIAEFERTSELFETLRIGEDEAVGLDPSFYARVNQRIEAERLVPFWPAFLQPATVRRLAFGTLMWLFALGAVTLYSDATSGVREQHLANHILAEQPPSGDYWVRMGSDLERNRSSMLAVMMASGE